ncbi:MAG: helix-turn-helix transcriptional regulator [bacterium]|nr:helix-turn-helix transcriptional regulator [bacterium]
MTFGEKLRYIRKKNKLSQQKLADMVKLHKNLIGRYEIGNSVPTAPALKKICEALNISADYLLFDKNENSSGTEISDYELLKQFEMIEQFPEEDKKVIKILIDAFISKNKIKEIVNS